MATKKKQQKKPTKTTGKKRTPPRQPAKKTKAPKKLPRKKAIAKRVAPKKATKKQAANREPIARKTAPPKKQTRENRQRVETLRFSPKSSGARSSEQSGDLQGLSRREEADSESVDELLEEGNAFEAEAIEGVEDAGDHEEQEVHTHEVSEDDVPEEYLDKD
jgi:hypothetical protein